MYQKYFIKRYIAFFDIKKTKVLNKKTIFKNDSNEEKGLLDKAVNWSTRLNAKHPRRQFKCTVMDVSGKTVILTRYFRPIKPPDDLIEDGEASFMTAVNK